MAREKRRYINEFIRLVSDILKYTKEINVTKISFPADSETLLTSLTVALYLALHNLLYLDSSLLIAQELFSKLLGAVCPVISLWTGLYFSVRR